MWSRYVQLPRAIHILALGTFINRAGTLLVVFLTLYLRAELNLGIEFATQCMGAYGLGSLGAGLVGGVLADRLGRRVVMLAALFGGAALLAQLSFLTSPRVIMINLVVLALVADMYRPAASAMIADLVAPEQRRYAYSLMYLAINLGFAVAPFLGGMLINRFSFQWLFWADALTAGCYGIIILLAIRETLRQRDDHDAPSTDTGAHEGASVAQPSRTSMMDEIKHLLTDRVFLMFCLASFFVGMIYMQSLSTFPLYLGERGIDAATYGKIIAVNGIMIVCLQLPMTALISRFNRASVVAASAIVAGAGFGLTGLVESVPMLIATVMVWTCGEMMFAPLAPSIVSDLAPVRLRARYMGVFGLSHSGANVIGAPLGGLVLVRWGGEFVWSATFVLALAAAVLYWRIRSSIRDDV